MLEKNEAIEETLTCRMFLYKLFQGVLGTAPNEGNLEILFGPTAQMALDICFKDKAGAFQSGLAGLESGYRANKEAFLDTLQDEYTRLFLGPSKLVAPPWESSYVEGGRQLFQESTLEVRKAYASQGFLPTEYRKVADDHIAIELGFLGELAQRALEAFAGTCDEKLNETLRESHAFLKAHPLKWVGRYTRDMSTTHGSGFFPTVANLMEAFLREDYAFLTAAVE